MRLFPRRRQTVSEQSSPPKSITPTGKVLYYTNQGWSHATSGIARTGKEISEGIPIYRGAIFAVWGVSVGDQITLRTEKGKIAQFLIINVEWCRDPHDMYFIEFYPVKYVE